MFRHPPISTRTDPPLPTRRSSDLNPLKYNHNNSANSRSLIESAVRTGVNHFIFSSTAATYGVPEESPVKESTPKRPINPYGMSKLMTEITLEDVSRAHDFRSEEHTSELQSLMRISYAVFCV